MPILETERLLLREFRLDDANFIIELLNEEPFLRYIGDKGVRNLSDAENYLATGPIASYATYGFGLYHVAEKSSGKAIGMCGLLKRGDQPYPDIGYAFLSSQTSNGFAIEAARAVMRFGQDALRLNTIDAFVNPDNVRSIRLLEKLGLAYLGAMQLDGIPRDQSHFRAEASA